MKAEYKKLRVALDTNVLVSAIGFKSKEVVKIWDLIEEEQFEVFVSAFILEELAKNLQIKAGFSVEEIEDTIAWVKDFVKVVHPRLKISVIHDKDCDNRILECAVEAKADVLVTGNMRHIRLLGKFQGIEILTPREFLNKYFQRM